MQGIVKKIVAEKNFGFISQTGAEKDLFFHANNLDGISMAELRESDTVTFDVEQTDKGPAAVNVKKV